MYLWSTVCSRPYENGGTGGKKIRMERQEDVKRFRRKGIKGWTPSLLWPSQKKRREERAGWRDEEQISRACA